MMTALLHPKIERDAATLNAVRLQRGRIFEVLNQKIRLKNRKIRRAAPWPPWRFSKL